MRILHVLDESLKKPLGGRGIHVKEIIKRIPGSEVLSCDEVHSSNAMSIAFPAIVHSVETTKRFLLVMAHNIITKGKYDIVHFHDGQLADGLVDLAKMTGSKVVYTVHLLTQQLNLLHGKDMPVISIMNDAYLANVERFAISEADEVIVCSKQYKELLKTGDNSTETYHKDTHLIPNGVNFEIFRKRKIKPHPKPTIMYFGRIARQKGIQKVIDLARKTNYNFIIVGGINTATEEEKLDNIFYKQLMELPKERVRVYDMMPQEELVELAREADVVIFPSVHEPFGMAMLETMALGIPMVVSGVDGMKDFCVDGKNCLFANKLDDWITQIERIINNKINVNSMVKQGIMTSSKYSWDSAAKKIQEVYDAIEICNRN